MSSAVLLLGVGLPLLAFGPAIAYSWAYVFGCPSWCRSKTQSPPPLTATSNSQMRARHSAVAIEKAMSDTQRMRLIVSGMQLQIGWTLFVLAMALYMSWKFVGWEAT